MRRVTQRFGLGRCILRRITNFIGLLRAFVWTGVDFLAGLSTPRRARSVRAADRARERAGAQRGELRLEPFDAAEVGLDSDGAGGLSADALERTFATYGASPTYSTRAFTW